MINRLRTMFYPTGKVYFKYNQYICWSLVSNVLVSAESALATHSVLSAIDTGSETIRTMNYIGKDIIGQMGGLLYMINMGKKADDNPRRFLLYSNLLQQISYLTICLTPMAPDYFLPIAGMSNILFNIAFTGFGAINAKCINKLSIDNNTGEIYAKVTVFSTMGSSIGLLMGLGITSLVPDDVTRLFVIPVLGAARVYSFNRAVRGLI